MKWLSAEETGARIAALTDGERLFSAYALSLFTDRALYCADFVPDEAWADAVVPSSSGRAFLKGVSDAGLQFSRHVELFALFRLFYHRELLIDHGATDTDRIRALLQQAHDAAQARWPYVFGNRLYHKFNDGYDGNRTDSLDATDADQLLENTPQGVFQLGRLLSGPLGFLESSEQRTTPPTLEIPLWHCSDPGCQAPHFVRLEQHKNECTRVKNAFRRHVLDNLGPPSEWHRPILRSYRRDRWPNGRPYSDLPAMLADCLIGSERTALCLRALRSPHNGQLIAALKRADRDTGTPEAVTRALTAEEQHQLLLLLPDRDLVGMIDELVCRKEIRIPPSELRRAKTYAYASSGDGASQLSSLGIRSTGHHPPLIELSASIWNTYESLGLADDLAWRVRGHAGATLRHSVMDLIRAKRPEAAVRELILPSRDVTARIADALTFSVRQEESEERTCNRILWKFGFNSARYEDEYVLLRSRIAQFREQVLQVSSRPSEEERAAVRASGVNLFVSVEEFLDDMLCYNVWLMTSDHFTGTHFFYTKQDARAAVARVLADAIRSGDETVHWSIDGANTIGVLLAYLNAFCAWLKSRTDTDRRVVARRKGDYPHYAKDTLWVFPFEHTELWADTTPEVMAAYVDLIDKTASQIAQSDLPLVRNGLDHKREDDAFPSSDTMLACVTRLQQIVDTADSRRLLPKLYWGTRSEQDADGNVCDTFADYRGTSLSLWEPSFVLAGPRKLFATPYLIAPFDFLNHPNSFLVFVVSPRTAYRDYWKDYPRRRVIPPEAALCDTEEDSEACDEQARDRDE